ncbi:MAG: glutaminyl-peptide cyclotransferase [Nitrospiraceae bacterium]|nr:glutaminyl-peptide cyclotransferase [Nitrospiraceae bacterium]
MGDLDGSGHVNAIDIQLIVATALGADTTHDGDVDDDGVVNAVDVQLVVHAALDPTVPDPIPNYGYRVVNEYPHDPEAFTQGLMYEDGLLLEGTGLYGQSSVRRVALATGMVVQQRDLAATYFGEGITVVGDRLLQLTWKSGKGFIYDKDSLNPSGSFSYSGQGWGLTYDGERLIMSDGSAYLRFLDPETFEQTGRIEVRGDSGIVTRLNELEYIRGEVFANVWQTDTIVRIAPLTGRVTGWIDLSGLLGKQSQPDVLNGIAYDAGSSRLFVTGKRWPKVFEIELVPK